MSLESVNSMNLNQRKQKGGHCAFYFSLSMLESMNSLFKQSQRYRLKLDVSGSTAEVQSDVGTPSDVLVSPLFCFQCQQNLSTLPHFFSLW